MPIDTFCQSESDSLEDYERSLHEEKLYLENTLAFLNKELSSEAENLASRKKELIASRKDMYENTVHFSEDFARLTEMNQYQSEINNQTAYCLQISERIKRYRGILDSPYFGRFDFCEDGSETHEIFYIGRFNVMDRQTHLVYVYDWRAPVSGIFYRNEPGQAEYTTPNGIVSGVVLLKRQYKIDHSELKYFIDSSIRITDEMLQEALSRNTSPQMRSIVETIQKEQDIIIRDTDNDILIVQGVAGSGKTSVALHRVAFLLYEGLSSKLRVNNVLIISPNDIFSRYISGILPELGEENVEELTFAGIADSLFGPRFVVESKDEMLEKLILSADAGQGEFEQKSLAFKGSNTFALILDRLLQHYAHREIPFEDVYYNGVTLETKHQLKNRFLNNKIGLPMAIQLKRIEAMLFDIFRPQQEKRLKRIENIVANIPEHTFEIKSYSRLLSARASGVFLERIRKFTQVDYWAIYRLLFDDPTLFSLLSEGQKLPPEIDRILSSTRRRLQKGRVAYEDCAPLLYLKLKIEGSQHFPDIKQVVIDEAQDYYPLQYEVFNLLFKNAKYTVLGDINQTVERTGSHSLFDEIPDRLGNRRASRMLLNKAYRSSFEINMFTQTLYGRTQDYLSFERHEQEPALIHSLTRDLMNRSIIEDIRVFRQDGYESIAVICKSKQEAVLVYSELKGSLELTLFKTEEGTVQKGVIVIPAYLAKGLEFDAVIVYGADKEKYSTELDQRLLYIACTRALHRLVIHYAGEKSPFLSYPTS